MSTASTLAPDRRAPVEGDPPRHLRVVDGPSPEARALAVEELVERHFEVARSIASRYRNRGIDTEDLQQVALLGLTKAAQRFDPDAGHDFLAFAVPTIRGEVRRHASPIVREGSGSAKRMSCTRLLRASASAATCGSSVTP